MYSPKELVTLEMRFDMEKQRMLNEMEKFCELCLRQTGTVIPRHTGLIFDFESSLYQQYSIDNIPISNAEEIKKAYITYCRAKYSFGSPTVFAVTALKIIIEIKEELGPIDEILGREAQISTRDAVLIYSQTEIESKKGIYLIKGNKIEFDAKLSQWFKPDNNVINLGFTLSSMPTLN